jgi:glycosyltransferase involved in cell wall biosynthesis
MITYNHEKFIAQAIESVLEQETDYKFELVIGEDHSADATRKICEDYQNRYPDKIRLLEAVPQNLGMMPNFVRTFAACDGDFIALLEGDDYWTAPDKLQMQVDFLLNNPDYSACFTDYQTIYSDTEAPDVDSHELTLIHDTLTLENLIEGNRIATCTVLYRNLFRDMSYDWLTNLQIGDWPTHMIHAQHGKFKFLKEPTGAYRIHSSNYYAGENREKKVLAEIEVLEAMIGQLEIMYHEKINQQIRWRYFALAHYTQNKQWLLTIKYRLLGLRKKSLKSWLNHFSIS